MHGFNGCLVVYTRLPCCTARRGQDIFFYKRYRDKNIRGRIRCAAATVERYLPSMCLMYMCITSYGTHFNMTLVMMIFVLVDELPFAFWLHTPCGKYHKKWLLQAACEARRYVDRLYHRILYGTWTSYREYSVDRTNIVLGRIP